MKTDQSAVGLLTTATRVVTAVLCASLLCAPARAQSPAEYPAKPVRIIVPFAPGGATDALARVVGGQFEKRFKQSFIVENRPGGFTLIGIDAVVKAPPDGYTLLDTSTNVATGQILTDGWTVKFDRDLTTLSVYAGSGYAIVVSTASGIKSLKELVEYVKANPGKVNQGHAGALSADMAILKHRLGMPPVEDVMYKGGPLAVQAITAGEVQLYGASTLDVASLHKAGKLRVIAYAEKQRHPLLPDVPTIAETNMGINDFEAGFWFALMGPANMPAEVVARINTAMQGTLKDPEFVDKVVSLGHRVYSMSPAESRAYIQNTVRQMEQAQAAGVKMR